MLESVAMKEPISLGEVGTLFWSKSHYTKQRLWGDTFEEFFKWCGEGWTSHYRLPRGGSFGLVLNLHRPLRQSGAECVRIFRGVRLQDGAVVTETKISTDEDDRRMFLKNLSLPVKFVLCLRALLMELEGEELFCDYCCLPEEGDALRVYVDFDDCQALTMEPDALLLHIAARFAEAFSK
ncbi:MAG: hypothetical protein HYU35_01790 [Parcubacteria group bacterium]|nr:hypothetical protein [Parcubacteria group bacterium]